MATNTTREVPRLITLQQAADSTQLSVRTLRRYIAEGNLTAYRAGRAIRLKPEDVDALFTPTNQWDGGAA
ncbi:helix-turn-helix domain-containing protein [Corynebacterium pseudodiphtheriticum]|uniref:helix-turn-helix domain-containing protein n=1 Tax=Corynebacterium pseudodiphtheriticum TaxID=37637 RepID=UPI002543B356|nr:helix-turn-helix domain-containing protein [Corynebacterium pseudodiphtheriticum]MDK4250594.1 helix-turn-helix domain-containing protein [Corynebacterium pseudodiphtheriticum]